MRATSRLGAVGALAALLVGCLPEEPTVDPADALPPVSVDERLGVVRVAPGDDLRIGVLLDGEADPEGLGAELEAAFRTAVEDFGAIQQDFRVALVTGGPAGCNADDAATATRALLESAEVVGILGPQCLASVLGAQTVSADAGLVLVTPRSTAVTLTVAADGTIAQDRAEGTWRTAPSALVQARAAATHVFEERGATRAAIVHDGTITGRGLADAFRGRFELLGGTVIVDEASPDGLVDTLADEPSEEALAARTTLLDAIDDGDVDVAYLALGGDELTALDAGWVERSALSGVTRIAPGATVPAALLASPSDAALLLTGPGIAPDEEAVSAVTGFSASQTLERVTATGVAAPTGWWAAAYDAATLLLKAVEDTSVVDRDGSLVISRAELRATLGRARFEGLTGPLACRPEGDCAAGRSVIRAVEPGDADDGDTPPPALTELPIVATLLEEAQDGS